MTPIAERGRVTSNLADLSTAIRNPPAQDRPGFATNSGSSYNFGRAHQAGFNMAFCDGTVKLMGWDIDPTIHMQLGHRRRRADAIRIISGNK